MPEEIFQKMIQEMIQELINKWPSPMVARTEIEVFSGGAMKEKYLANLDSAGLGPAGRFRVGRKVVYPTKNAAEWLALRSTVIPLRVRRTE